MSTFEALPIRIIDPDDAASQHDLFSFFLSEQPLAREAIDDRYGCLLAALGAGEACAFYGPKHAFWSLQLLVSRLVPSSI